jgi:hypothetical protein
MANRLASRGPPRHRPHITRIPRSAAAPAISSARRVLPMPGSPEIKKSLPRPAIVSSRPATNLAVSRSRPKSELALTLWLRS